MNSNRCFINFTNHASRLWGETQRKAALQYGDEIRDIPFPNVPAAATETDIAQLAQEYVEKIKKETPSAVLCQGEFTLSYQIIRLLLQSGIPVVAACSERTVTEVREEEKVIKRAEYEFVRFRKYEK